MSTQNESVWALVAEAVTDTIPRDYVSEGLYMTAVALNSDRNNKRIVLSSNILGPTWFSDTALGFNSKITTGKGPATKESYGKAVASGQILSLNEMMSVIIDPSWRLTEASAEEMVDFGFLKQALLLNVLNGFEYMMSNVFKSAAEFVAFFNNEKHRPAWLVDAGIILKDGSGTTSTADVAVGRARRIVALFCYTLIDILKWKKAISERAAARGLIPFKCIPRDAPYEQLIILIEERGKTFIEGLLGGGDVATLVPSVTTVLASAVAAAEDGFSPRVIGTFYESILGYKIMSLLSILISAEYNALLSRITEKHATVSGHLEKYVADPSLEIPSENVTEAEKLWIRKEVARREKLSGWERESEIFFRTRSYLGSAIDIEPTFNNNDAAMKALHREVKREMDKNLVQNPDDVLESKVVTARQPLFSNFSVLRVRPGNSASRFSMYVLWNTLFLATGGITSATAAINGVRSRLFINFFLKDLHALFNCPRCEHGFLIKTLDTFSVWEKEKKSPGKGKQELLIHLGAALYALCGKENIVNNEESVGQLIYNILSFTNPGDQERLTSLAVSGKIRLKNMDSDIRSLHRVDGRAYAVEGARYVSVSKGFTILAFYLLYASAATSPQIPSFLKSRLDRAVTLLLARWGDVRFPAHNLWRDKSDESSSPLLAYAAFWALRNAVRARRNVEDPTNTTFIPGRPLTLLEALPSLKNMAAILNNNYVQPSNIENQNLIWKALEELKRASEVSEESVRRVRHDMNFNTIQRSELLREPAGLVPTTSSLTVSTVLFPSRKQKLSNMVKPSESQGAHPLSAVGQISLSVDDLKTFSKETYAKLPSFPLTPFDV